MKIIKGFFMAWGCFSIIPCPYKKWDEEARNQMLLALPIIGLLIGAIWLLLNIFLQKIAAPFFLSAVLVALCPQILSGFIHADGYMDCCDAIFSRKVLSEKQKILKDSNVGAFAVIGLFVLGLLTFAAVCDAIAGEQILPALLFIPMISRFMSVLAVWKYRPIAHSQYARAEKTNIQNIGKSKNMKYRLLAAIFVMIALIIFDLVVKPQSELIYGVLLIEMIGHYVTCLYARRQLGGMSGDISGFAISISESLALISLAIL